MIRIETQYHNSHL